MYRIIATLIAGGAIVAAPPPVFAVTADDVIYSKCVGTGDLGKNAVTQKKLKKNAVTSKAINNRSVKKADLHPSVIAGPANVVHVAGNSRTGTASRHSPPSVTGQRPRAAYSKRVSRGSWRRSLGSVQS